MLKNALSGHKYTARLIRQSTHAVRRLVDVARTTRARGTADVRR